MDLPHHFTCHVMMNDSDGEPSTANGETCDCGADAFNDAFVRVSDLVERSGVDGADELVRIMERCYGQFSEYRRADNETERFVLVATFITVARYMVDLEAALRTSSAYLLPHLPGCAANRIVEISMRQPECSCGAAHVFALAHKFRERMGLE